MSALGSSKCALRNVAGPSFSPILRVRDLKSTIPKLDGMKVSDFMDASLIRDIGNEGFFTRLEKQ